jgi:hypothetical protein
MYTFALKPSRLLLVLLIYLNFAQISDMVIETRRKATSTRLARTYLEEISSSHPRSPSQD